MATVWLGLDNRLARRVAIKIPSEEILADESFSVRFEREAQIAAALSHPHLVSVHDYGCEGERPYLVSEFVNGSNLAQLRDQGRAPSTEALAEALLDALAHIHKAGIVHRDIKPGNVLVDKAGHILLTDFGIAQSSEATRLTIEGHVVGTPSYLAPEIERGGRATAASDLYSLGVLLSEQHSERDPDRIGRLIEALTSADPADRPGGADEAREIAARRTVNVTAVNPVPGTPQPVTEVAPRTPRPAAAVLPPAGRSGRPEMGAGRTSGDGTVSGGSGRSGSGRLIVGGLIALVLVAVAAIALASGGDGENASGGKESGDRQASRTTTEAPPSTATTTSTVTETADAPPSVAAPAGGGDSARGIELNNEGYALLQAGDVAGALPKLRQAVASFPDDTTEIDYAYALFNYAHALRLSGDPAAAIPLLEKRLAISDFKVDEVRAELEAAQQAAGG
jgi:serine/threonine-protein kinase